MKTIDRFDAPTESPERPACVRVRRRGIHVVRAARISSLGPPGLVQYRLHSGGRSADNFYITMDCGARAKAESLGNITIDTQAPERFDQTLQTPILNAVVQSAPDAIMMAPNDSRGMIAPIQAAIDAGVPVLCVDTTIDAEIQLGDVATDNVEGGRLAARGLAEQIGAAGKVFVVNVKPGISTTDQREQGFREAIGDRIPRYRVPGSGVL